MFPPITGLILRLPCCPVNEPVHPNLIYLTEIATFKIDFKSRYNGTALTNISQLQRAKSHGFCPLLTFWSSRSGIKIIIWELPDMMAPSGGGVSWKSRCRCSKGGCVNSIYQVQMWTRGEGVKNKIIFADIMSGCSLFHFVGAVYLHQKLISAKYSGIWIF